MALLLCFCFNFFNVSTVCTAYFPQRMERIFSPLYHSIRPFFKRWKTSEVNTQNYLKNGLEQKNVLSEAGAQINRVTLCLWLQHPTQMTVPIPAAPLMIQLPVAVSGKNSSRLPKWPGPCTHLKTQKILLSSGSNWTQFLPLGSEPANGRYLIDFQIKIYQS